MSQKPAIWSWQLLLVGSILFSTASFLLSDATGRYLSGIACLSYKQSEGKVIEIVKEYSFLGDRKIAKIEYIANSPKKFMAELELPNNRVIKEGELLQLFFDPNELKKISLSQEVDYDNTIVRGAFGLALLCLSMLILSKSKKLNQ